MLDPHSFLRIESAFGFLVLAPLAEYVCQSLPDGVPHFPNWPYKCTGNVAEALDQFRSQRNASTFDSTPRMSRSGRSRCAWPRIVRQKMREARMQRTRLGVE
jgi:hypothetical protein